MSLLDMLPLLVPWDGKTRNRTLNVANSRPTRKTECKAKINALRQDGVIQLMTIRNIHMASIQKNLTSSNVIEKFVMP